MSIYTPQSIANPGLRTLKSSATRRRRPRSGFWIARDWFAAHGITHIERIVTDNGACYRAAAFAAALGNARHQRIAPYAPRHNGKIERYNRIIAEEFLYTRTWISEDQRRDAIDIWNVHYNYHRPHGAPTDSRQPLLHRCASTTSSPHTSR
jgi:transposase InsO family protein